MNENFIITQGSSISIAGTLEDSAGNPILNTYTGIEVLSTTIWPGGTRPASFAPATTWLVPAAGTFLIAITAAESATLYPGVYEGMTRVASGGDVADAFYFNITVAPAPGGIPSTFTSGAITRLACEIELVDRDSALLLLCGKSTTADGNNRFLTGALGMALNALGINPAIPGVVTDADLAQLDSSQFYTLLDLSEYRLIKNLLSNFAQPDQTSGNTKIHLNSMTERFRRQMLDLEQQYASYLGKYKAVLGTGSIRVRPSSGDVGTWGYGGSYSDY